jgi:hypothetical protein
MFFALSNTSSPSFLKLGLRLVILIIVFTHVVFGFFQSLHSSVMGNFDPMCVSLGSWVLGFLRRSSDGFRMIPVIGVKWGEFCGLGNRIVVCKFW